MNRMKITTSEWCTYAAAAEMLGVSARQVGRYVDEGILHVCLPIVGSRESSRTKRMVAVADVRELREARRVVGRG